MTRPDRKNDDPVSSSSTVRPLDREAGAISLRATLLLCAVLVLMGAAALMLIFNTEPEVQRESAVRETAMLVDVISVEAGTFRPVIEAMGTVRPARATKAQGRKKDSCPFIVACCPLSLPVFRFPSKHEWLRPPLGGEGYGGG